LRINFKNVWIVRDEQEGMAYALVARDAAHALRQYEKFLDIEDMDEEEKGDMVDCVHITNLKEELEITKTMNPKEPVVVEIFTR
jgi:hypothetical protein